MTLARMNACCLLVRLKSNLAVCEFRSTGVGALKRNPAVLKALAAFRGALAREGSIDPVIRELVRIKIAQLNACRY